MILCFAPVGGYGSTYTCCVPMDSPEWYAIHFPLGENSGAMWSRSGSSKSGFVSASDVRSQTSQSESPAPVDHEGKSLAVG